MHVLEFRQKDNQIKIADHTSLRFLSLPLVAIDLIARFIHLVFEFDVLQTSMLN